MDKENYKVYPEQLKHDVPLLCRVNRMVFGVSPSIVFSRCTYGVKWNRKACENCYYCVSLKHLINKEKSRKK